VVTFLLDTNVLSEIRKPAADRHVAAWFDAVPTADLFISVLVIGEVRRGIELLRRRRDLAQADALERWLAGLRETYGDRVVPITVDVAEAWGRLSVPDPLPLIDGLLAATAIVHGWTLVTRNTDHVARTGVRVLNPFDPPAR
jgi:predicted nucleic acid-binding protein